MSDELSINAGDEARLVANEPEHGPRWVFFGSEGLRAGWGALLFVVLFVALSVLVGFVGKFVLHVHPPDGRAPMPPLLALVLEAVNVAIVMLVAWILARAEGRRLAVYGYAGRARVSRFLWGGLWGFIALSALVGVLWKAHLLTFDAGHLQGFPAFKYGLAWLVMFICVGIFEESLLRGYLQYTLTRGIGFWWGALLMSIVFGAIHGSNKGESPVGLFSAGAVGLVFCISLWYTGSLWWAIGFHASWDWAQSYFYGTSDSGMVTRGHLLTEHPVGPLLWSGGPTGPEGSLYIVPLLLIIALAMWLWWRRKGVATPYRLDV